MKVIEALLTSAGISPIAGVDEAGRGACAGPLVIASVVLNDPFAAELAVVRDSKEIAESKRDAVFDLIHQVAASVIAKVTRDRIMRELDREFPLYGFAGHKGYITAAHTKALNEHGPCAQHRRSFANVAALIHK